MWLGYTLGADRMGFRSEEVTEKNSVAPLENHRFGLTALSHPVSQVHDRQVGFVREPRFQFGGGHVASPPAEL
jgi:hypothetical protein